MALSFFEFYPFMAYLLRPVCAIASEHPHRFFLTRKSRLFLLISRATVFHRDRHIKRVRFGAGEDETTMKQLKHAARRLAVALILAALLTAQALAAVPAYLIPGGNTVGLKLYTKGLVITAVADGTAAQAAGLKPGDTITAAGGKALDSADALRAQLSAQEPLILTVQRGSQEAEFLVTPDCSDGVCRLGVSLRDHVAGIGTVTYYDPDTKRFGALGHGVSSASDLRLIPVASGFVVPSSVCAVVKGTRGAPGMLKGSFDLTQCAGTVTANRESGVFGVMQSLPHRAALPVAQVAEVHTGPATILSNVDGTSVREFGIEILKLQPGAKNGRNLLLRVTDPELLSITGGIVQGMSGSPILQDGKLIGAVTHVLVSDPERGYGIFIENMLDAAA